MLAESPGWARLDIGFWHGYDGIRMTPVKGAILMQVLWMNLIMALALSLTTMLPAVTATHTQTQTADVLPVFTAQGAADETFALTLPEDRYFLSANAEVGSAFFANTGDKALSVISFGGGSRSDLVNSGKPYACEEEPLEISSSGAWVLSIYRVDDFDSTPMANPRPRYATACYEGRGSTIIHGVNLDAIPYTLLIETDGMLWIYGPHFVNMPISEPGMWETFLTAAPGGEYEAFENDLLFVDCYGADTRWRITIYSEAEDAGYIYRPEG